MKQRSNVRRLFAFVLRYYKINFVVVFICIAVSSVISLATSLFTRTLIDDHIAPMLASGADLDAAYSALALALVKLGAILLVGIICGYLHNLLMIYVGQGTMRRLRDSLFTHMESLPLRYFDSHSHGDIMSVYTNDVDTLRQVIGSSIPNLVKSIVTIVATLVSMLVLSLPLTLITVVMALCIYRVTTGLGKLSKKYFVQRQQNLGKVNGFIEEMVSGQKVVKAYCREDRTGEEFEVLNEALRASVYNANKIGNIIMPVNHNISNFGYVALSVAGALIALGGFSQWYFLGLNGSVLTLGTLVSFLTLQRNFTRPVQQISNEINSIVMASAGADRLFALLDETPEPDEGKVVLVNATADIPSQDLRHPGSPKKSGDFSGNHPRLRGRGPSSPMGGAELPAHAGSAAVGEGIPASGVVETDQRTGLWAWKRPDGSLKKLEGLVELDTVDFGYVPEKQVLDDITLTAYPGQKIAFVGGTGAGKTTITNLINRFYEIQSGSIKYDGFPVSEISKESLRRSLGTVLQETKLFSGTVLENIRYGRLDATDDECRAAARSVHADSFIRRLPHGYDTMLDADGGNLSQGERQLLSIARAAVADPPVLILDEATSSIDTRTEKLIQQGIESLMKGRTSFIIAHRLSTVQNCDYICVLDHGRIIERGKHQELLDQKGKYFELYTGNQIV